MGGKSRPTATFRSRNARLTGATGQQVLDTGSDAMLNLNVQFKKLADAGAKQFTDAMLIAAAETLALTSPENELVPDPLNPEVHQAVAEAVAFAARHGSFDDEADASEQATAAGGD